MCYYVVYKTEIHTANLDVNKKTYYANSLYEICYLCYEYYYPIRYTYIYIYICTYTIYICHWIDVEKIKATKWMIPMLKPIMLNTIYKIETKKN